MRIHRLELEAFGPFAGRETVDMESLNDAGLFLLDGPTGSGKSTVLAAVCFALYGTVPGKRTADTVASTHAPIGTRPEVLIDVTLGGRRFEILRWPRYQRLKQRRSVAASPYTEEKAGAQLREMVDGTWTELSVRADEIGQLLRTVLPLDSEQFMHVIMLPQGEFARFLRSEAKDKEDLLRKLFGTGRFDHVESFLKQRSQQLAEAVRQDQQYAERVRDELDQSLTRTLGERSWTSDDVAELSVDETVTQLSDAQLADRAEQVVAAARQHAVAECTATETALTEARRHAQDLQERTTQITAARRWLERSEAHQAVQQQIDADRARWNRHRAAVPIARRIQDLTQAEQAADTAADQARQALHAALTDPRGAQWAPADSDPAPEPAESTESTDTAETAAPVVRHLLTQADRALEALNAHEHEAMQLRDLTQTLEQAPAEAERWERRISSLEQAITTTTTELQTLDETVQQLSRSAAGAEAAQRELDAARARSEAARAAEQAATELIELEEVWRQTRDTAADAREHWHGLVEQRLTHAAALLAAELEEGHPCPVCGGTEHPHPATITPDQDPDQATRLGEQLTPQALERAEQESQRTAELRDAAQTRMSQARERQQSLHLRAGELTVEETDEHLLDAQHVVDQRRAEATELQTLIIRRRDLTASLDRHRADKTEAISAHTRFQTTTEQQRQDQHRLQTRLDQVLEGRPDLDALRQELTAARTLVETADRAVERWTLTRATAEQERAALDRELATSGYDSAEEASAALLGDEQAAELERTIRDWDREEAALAELISTTEVARGRDLIAAGAVPATSEDLQQADDDVATLSQAHQAAVGTVGALEVLAGQVTAQATGLRAAHDRSAGQRERAEEAESLLTLVRGGGENDYKMRLASYVLTGRLEDVAAAATERLLTMTDGRYELVHDDSVSGAGRKGLDLVVRDLYTDSTRSSATLSGGETFMASLALALGLADTVQAEAGGVEMDTLFIDEGFGSLDADTLDQVMQVLDGLREGGRTLGVVSHVDRMRQEIETRLQVTKTRHGSHLSVVLPTGSGDYSGAHAS